MERIYPTFWEGVPYGLPFASVSCASNQGFQYRATRDFCRMACGMGFRYIGAIPVHAIHYNDSRAEVPELASKLAAAALIDEREGRKKLSDREIFTMYNGAIWDLVDGYLQNLTANTFSYEDSIPVKALRNGQVSNPEALPLIENVCTHLKTALDFYHAGNRDGAAMELALAAKYWTNGTYLQCCQNLTVDAKIPDTYRPLDES